MRFVLVVDGDDEVIKLQCEPYDVGETRIETLEGECVPRLAWRSLLGHAGENVQLRFRLLYGCLAYVIARTS